MFLQVGYEPLAPRRGKTFFGKDILHLPGFFDYGKIHSWLPSLPVRQKVSFSWQLFAKFTRLTATRVKKKQRHTTNEKPNMYLNIFNKNSWTRFSNTLITNGTDDAAIAATFSCIFSNFKSLFSWTHQEGWWLVWLVSGFGSKVKMLYINTCKICS